MGRSLAIGCLLGWLLWPQVAAAQDTRYATYPESNVLHVPPLEKLPAVQPTPQPVVPPASVPPANSLTPLLPMPAYPPGEQVIVAPQPAALPPPVKLWEGNIELGLSGSAGNSETMSFRFATHLERDTQDRIATADLLYRKTHADGTETANNLLGEGRHEWILGSSNWTYFVHGTAEYDEFRAFDLRLAGDTGLGHYFIRNDITELQTRGGAGVSHEIGGPDDSYVPEAVAGLTVKHKLSDRQRFLLTSDYYGDWTDFNDFRINSQMAWELLLDEAMNLSLKLSVLDRYDSTPNGAKHNDIDYAATMLWAF